MNPGSIRYGAIAVAPLLLAACATDSNATPPGTPPATAPVRELINPGDILSDASRFGDLIFTAGHLPDDETAAIDEQVESALDNLEATLAAAGGGFDTLLKVNVSLADWDDWDAFNAIYVRRISEYGLPPRATVEIVGLGFGSLIEIEATAHVRTSSP